MAGSIPLQREWGWLAVGPYAIGCGVAAWGWRRRKSRRFRAWLAAVVFVGVALVPLAVEVTWRADSASGLHAQSEVLVTEEAAKALVAGRDPYGATFLHGSLAARPRATKTHFPYGPAMAAFGIPRALDGRSPVSDARVWFAAFTVAVAGLALRWWPGTADGALRMAHVIVVLPTGALLMATGGDDLPVLALMALALVLLRREQTGWAGFAAGLAGAMKQTAWPLVVVGTVLLWRAHRGDAGRTNTWWRFTGAALAVAVASFVPFAAWNLPALVENVIRFPLGLARERSAAGTTTIGSAAVRWLPGGRGVVVPILAALVLAVAAWVLVRTRDHGAAGVARASGLILLAAFVLSPSARFGDVVYPVDLLVWATLLPRSTTFGGLAPLSSSRALP